MCEICSKIKGLPPKTALQIIAAKMMVGAGRPMDPHLSKVMDRLLGTFVEEEVDEEQEQAAFRAMSSRRHPSGD